MMGERYQGTGKLNAHGTRGTGVGKQPNDQGEPIKEPSYVIGRYVIGGGCIRPPKSKETKPSSDHIQCQKRKELVYEPHFRKAQGNERNEKAMNH